MSSSDARPVCVLGVGRSGTSLAARALNVLGVDLGPEETMVRASDLPPGAPDNPMGFWEQLEIVRLNHGILGALGAGARWQLPRRPPGWEAAPELEPFRARIAELVERCFDGRRWGFKHPQTTLTLPLWRSVVGEFDHVICVRNPLEVIASVGADGAPPGYPIWLWTHFICEALRLTEGRRRMFVFYEDWSKDPQAVGWELARFLDGAADPEAANRAAAVFDPDLHRQRASDVDLAECDDMPVGARALHFLVRDLAAAERRGHESARALQALAARLDSADRRAEGTR